MHDSVVNLFGVIKPQLFEIEISLYQSLLVAADLDWS